MNIEMTIERNDEEIEILVELDYQPASRGSRDRYGVPLEPDEPESFEVVSANDSEGKEYTLTSAEEQKAIEQAISDRNAAMEDYEE